MNYRKFHEVLRTIKTTFRVQYQSTIIVPDDDAFTVEYITNRLATGELHNDEANIEVLFRSIDGVDL